MGVRRFTMVELMIVVAIVMILAAIAVPQLYRMQLASKRAEGSVNLSGILDAIVAYDVAHDCGGVGCVGSAVYACDTTGSGGLVPDGNPGKSARAMGTSALEDCGYVPDGLVRCSYSALTYGNGDFELSGQCDVDGDNVNAGFGAGRTGDVIEQPVLGDPSRY